MLLVLSCVRNEIKNGAFGQQTNVPTLENLMIFLRMLMPGGGLGKVGRRKDDHWLN